VCLSCRGRPRSVRHRRTVYSNKGGRRWNDYFYLNIKMVRLRLWVNLVHINTSRSEISPCRVVHCFLGPSSAVLRRTNWKCSRKNRDPLASHKYLGVKVSTTANNDKNIDLRRRRRFFHLHPVGFVKLSPWAPNCAMIYSAIMKVSNFIWLVVRGWIPLSTRELF
jgi:hypothetical protein